MVFGYRRGGEKTHNRPARRLGLESLESRDLLSGSGLGVSLDQQNAALVAPAAATPAISAPATFTANPLSGTQIRLNWSAVSGAQGYRLYDIVNGAPKLLTQLGTTTTTTVSNLTANTTYSFNLVAFSGTQTAATPWISATTLGTFAAPTNFSGTALSNSQISLSWGPSSGATGYRLYQSVNGNPVLIQTLAAGATSATVSSLQANTTYAFNLIAFTNTQSAPTAWISVSTSNSSGTVTAPTNFVASPLSDTQIGLTWTAGANAAGYRLYQSVGGGTPVLINTLAASATSATASGLLAGTTYTFTLTAFNGSQTASAPAVSATTTGSSGALTPPTNFSGSALSSSQVTLSWTAATGQTGYYLYQLVNGSPALIQTLAAGTTTTTVNNLAPNTVYQFNLVAFNNSTTSASPWISVSTGGQVSPPANFTGTATSATQIALSWSLSAGATGYQLYQIIGGQPTLIATYGPTTTGAMINNLTPNTSYAFNLVAFNGATTAPTSWIGVTTSGLGTPGNFSAAPLSNTQIGLSWIAASGATGYRLYEFINGQAVLIQTLAAGATSTSVGSLQPNTTYAFNLVAFNATQSAATAWVSATTTTANLQPPSTFVGAPLSSTQVTLSWSTVTGATGYRLYQFQNGAPLLIGTFNFGTNSTIVNNLSPSTQYAFNLVAFNAAQAVATPWIAVSTTV